MSRGSDNERGSPTPGVRHISQTRVVGDYPNYSSTLENSSPVNSECSKVNDNLIDTDSIIIRQTLNGSQKKINNGHLKHSRLQNVYTSGEGEQLSLLAPTPSASNPIHPTSSHDFQRNAKSSLTWRNVLPYYLPILSWIPNYGRQEFFGDLLGGLSLVFFQLPLSLSYASSLAKVPILCGLYSLAISPLIYMIFGSVPQMIVGPEAAISLIVGQAVEPLIHHSKKHPVDPVELVVAITFVSGATLLGFGIGRFGFLDNVLSASLLKGFISGVGIVMVVNSSIVMLGLSKLLNEITNDPNLPDIHSPFDKFCFLLTHFKQAHALSTKISLAGFFTIMAVRIFKKWYEKSRKNVKGKSLVVYIPEILIVVIVSTAMCQHFRYDHQGVEIIGKFKQDISSSQFHNPFSRSSLVLSKKLITSGFLCAMLGFFESTTASKSLGSSYGLPISSNRELVALGFINIMGSMFGALPAFGGYGRSKINAISAKTCMSGAIMGVCTLFTIYFLMEYLHFIPKCTLNVVTAVIGISLIEEAPMELWFHWKSAGYSELITFGITVCTTLFFSMEAGITVGLIYSLIRVIKHSAFSRIQILGRVPHTNTFLNADLNLNEPLGHEMTDNYDEIKQPQLNLFTDNFTQLNYQALEDIEGCLIIKIPEPLTFTNASDLKTRLRRVEMYGSPNTHPAMKRTRDAKMTKYIIFDVFGMTEMDSSAAKVLRQLLDSYEDRRIYCFFVRVNKEPKLRKRLLNTGIYDLLMKDLVDLHYFEAQEQPSLVSNSGHDISNLTESKKLPYFEHISDALKVIDCYETVWEATPIEV